MLVGIADKMKRMMGWCPNMNSMNNDKVLHFDEVMVNAPDSDNKLKHSTGKWLNKYRNKVLVYTLFFTLLGIHFFISDGMNKTDIFLIGIITGFTISLVIGVIEWRRFNKIAVGRYKNRIVTQKNMIVRIVIVIGLMLGTILVTMYLIGKIGRSNYYAFFAGLILFVWIQYFEIIYWELKNKKTLILDKTSFYAVDAKTMRSEQ